MNSPKLPAHVQWCEHADRKAFATAVADALGEVIDEAAAERGRALLALAGGSTPAAAYQQLGQHQRLDTLIAVPTDERWVPPDDDLSNERMLRAALGDSPDIRRLSAAPEHSSPDAAGLAAAAVALAPVDRDFDAVLMGMGDDGHCASLFPDDPGIEAALASSDDLVAAFPASQPTPRVSLTPLRLLRTRRMLIAICGQSKRDVLSRALEPGPAAALPIRAILREDSIQIVIHYAP